MNNLYYMYTRHYEYITKFLVIAVFKQITIRVLQLLLYSPSKRLYKFYHAAYIAAIFP